MLTNKPIAHLLLMPTVGVIGAGIAGLATAFHLHKEGISVRVLEASDRTGGVIRSEATKGFLVEHGPNSIRAGSAALEQIIAELSLEDERVWANDAADTRYIVRNGTPLPLPTSIRSFLSTDLFSTRAKLRLLAEPFVGTASSNDESIADFTRRRLGPEVLEYAVAPFVGGVFAASPDNLSVRHALGRLADLEDEYGSLFLGAVRRALSGDDADEPDVPSGLFSFRGGLETLPNALSDALGNRVHLSAPVRALHQHGDQWRVTVDGPHGEQDARTFDAIVSTIPLHRLTAMDVETPIDLNPLSDVWYPPLSVLALGYPRDAVAHPLDGFGMLVPPVENDLNILGTIFSSTLFPGRAPDDCVLLTTFVGGGRAPEQATLEPSQLQDLVEPDLDRLLGVEGPPVFRRHIYWPKAIPQYTVGYGQIKETLANLERTHPRLAFAGNYRQGVSVSDALESGVDAAQRLQRRLETTAQRH